MPHPTPAANRLSALRHRGNFDPRQLAEAMGLSVPGYLKLETSDRLYRGVTLYKLTKLARTLNVQPMNIFTDAAPAGGSATAPFIPLVHCQLSLQMPPPIIESNATSGLMRSLPHLLDPVQLGSEFSTFG